MTVVIDGRQLEAFVYVIEEGDSLGMLSQSYVNTIAEGYESAVGTAKAAWLWWDGGKPRL